MFRSYCFAIATAALVALGCSADGSPSADAAVPADASPSADAAARADGSPSADAATPADGSADAPAGLEVAAPDTAAVVPGRDGATAADVASEARTPQDGAVEAGSAADAAPTRPTGSTCNRGVECATGFCVDGFCCLSRRCDVCSSCGLAARPGTCQPIRSGADPDSCTMCDVNGACQSRATRVSPLGWDAPATAVGQ